MVGGNADYIREILKVKSQMDSGMFRPLQLAAATALGEGPDWFSELNSEYARRKAAASEIFDALGVSYDSGSQGLFLWGRVEEDNPAYVKAASRDMLWKARPAAKSFPTISSTMRSSSLLLASCSDATERITYAPPYARMCLPLSAHAA